MNEVDVSLETINKLFYEQIKRLTLDNINRKQIPQKWKYYLDRRIVEEN